MSLVWRGNGTGGLARIGRGCANAPCGALPCSEEVLARSLIVLAIRGAGARGFCCMDCTELPADPVTFACRPGMVTGDVGSSLGKLSKSTLTAEDGDLADCSLNWVGRGDGAGGRPLIGIPAAFLVSTPFVSCGRLALLGGLLLPLSLTGLGLADANRAAIMDDVRSKGAGVGEAELETAERAPAKCASSGLRCRPREGDLYGVVLAGGVLLYTPGDLPRLLSCCPIAGPASYCLRKLFTEGDVAAGRDAKADAAPCSAARL